MKKASGYRLGVAVDIVVFTVFNERLHVLLTLRPSDPLSGHWALPGGFVGQTESADQAAERELRAKAGVAGVFLEQLYTFSDPHRDPRSRVVSITYYALVSGDRLRDRAGSRESRWFLVGTNDAKEVQIDGEADEQIELAFDHAEILQTAIDRIRGKLEYVPIGFQLLPTHFTLTDLQRVHEAILGREIDKRNFRTKIRKSGLIREVDGYRTGAHRPARLFEFVNPTF